MLADRYGRRVVLRWTLGIVIVGTLSSALAQTMPQLIALRFLTALGLGGETVLGYAMLTEFLPPSSRGRGAAFLGLIANFGMPLALRDPIGPRVSANPAAAPADAPYDRSTQSAFRTIFAPHNRRRLIVGSTINIGIMSAIFGFVSWIPTFFASEGRDIASSVLFAAVMSIGSPLGVFLGLLVAERIERSWGIVAFSLLAALLGAGYVLADTPAIILAMGFVVVTTIYLTGTLGMTSYVPELFPTHHRMRSVGVCTTVGRAAGIALPFAVVPIFSSFGQSGVVAMIAVILVAQAGIVAWLGLSTNSRPLESI